MKIPLTEYTWRELFQQVLQHRRALIIANSIAIIAALISVPIPLLIPLLVDEVLLNKPAVLVGWMNAWFPADWHGAVLYIAAITVLTMIMRLLWLVASVYQTREFTLISKNITFQIRQRLLSHIETISMTEYETLGSGTVSSRLVVDVETIDQFLGISISKFVVAILTLIGVVVVLLWLHWQLALFILLLNPVVILMTTKLGSYVKTLKTQENSAFELFQQALTETLDTVQQIRASNRARNFFARVTTHAEAVKIHAGQFAWRSDAANRLSFTLFIAGFDVFLGRIQPVRNFHLLGVYSPSGLLV